jgi:hypothetical protein
MSRAGIGEFWLPIPERFFSELWVSAPYGRKNKAPEAIAWGVCFWLLKQGQTLVQNKIRTWSGRSADYVRRLMAEVEDAYQTWVNKHQPEEEPESEPKEDRQSTVNSSSTDRQSTVNPDVVTDVVVEEAPSAYRPVSVNRPSTDRQHETLYPRARSTDTRTDTGPTTATSSQEGSKAERNDALLMAFKKSVPGLGTDIARCLWLVGCKTPDDLQTYASRAALCGTLTGLKSCEFEAPRSQRAIRFLQLTGIPNVANKIEEVMLANGWRFGSVVLDCTEVAPKNEVFDRPHKGVKLRSLQPEQLESWLKQQPDYTDLLAASQNATQEDLLRWLTPRVGKPKRLLVAAFNHLQTRQEVAA